jgi:hypothetical protein
MNSVFTLKFLTLVFTFLASALTMILAPIAIVIRPRTIKNRQLRTVLHHGNKIAWLRLYREVFKVTPVVTALKGPLSDVWK